MSFAVGFGRHRHEDDNGVKSVTARVADQDPALRFHTQVLGCELSTDSKVWPGARLVEVVAPASAVGVVLLPPDRPLPLAVRTGTTDAEVAHARLRVAGVNLHNEEVLRMEGAPPMFHLSDPDGDGLVHLEGTALTHERA